MRQTTSSTVPTIDAVITWVDGADPAHRARRGARLAQAAAPLHENAINPHRWGSDDELRFCLTSLAHHARWIRWIWLVTDDQRPDLSRVPSQIAERLRVVDHREIFQGYEHALPCFNSLSIETVLWRIPDLADKFLYFNDDVFLTAPLRPEDVFDDNRPVLRGKWVDHSALAAAPERRGDPALFNHFTQINAAHLAGVAPARMWSSAHVVHPLRRSVLERLFAQYEATFVANLSHPFRDLDQFQPMALHNHALLRAGGAVQAGHKDYLHMKSGAVLAFPHEKLRARMQQVTSGNTKFLCVNDLPQLSASIPEARDWIARAVGA